MESVFTQCETVKVVHKVSQCATLFRYYHLNVRKPKWEARLLFVVIKSWERETRGQWMGKHTIWLQEQIILPAGLKECEDENRVLKSLPTQFWFAMLQNTAAASVTRSFLGLKSVKISFKKYVQKSVQIYEFARKFSQIILF